MQRCGIGAAPCGPARSLDRHAPQRPGELARERVFTFQEQATVALALNAIYNSQKIIEIFKGISNEFSEAVSLNAAAGLIVSGKENDFKNAFDKATKHLSSGEVFEHLTKLQSK